MIWPKVIACASEYPGKDTTLEFKSLSEATSYLLDSRNPVPQRMNISFQARDKQAIERWRAMMAKFDRTRSIRVDLNPFH